MTGLLVFILVAAVVTAWFLSRPLSAPVQGREDRDGLLQLRDRLLGQLREMEIEAADRNIDAVVVDDERRRLEAELARVLKDLEVAGAVAEEVQPAAPRRFRLVTVVALGVILPVVSGGFYFGSNTASLAQLEQVQAMARSGETFPPMVLQMVARLEQRLVEQPDDAEGWAQLGRSYAVLGRPEDARRAYRQALQLAPEHVEIMGAYAAFLLGLDPSQPPPEAVALFRKLYALDPKHPGALWALGIVAYRKEEFGQAVQYWEQLLAELPAGSEVESQIQRAIADARARSHKPN